MLQYSQFLYLEVHVIGWGLSFDSAAGQFVDADAIVNNAKTMSPFAHDLQFVSRC